MFMTIIMEANRVHLLQMFQILSIL